MAETPSERKEPLALQVLEKLSALMTAAFGFVAALAWNDAIKALIQAYISGGESLRTQFTYAFFVTLIAVLTGIWVAWGITRVKRRLRREDAMPSGRNASPR